MRVLILHHVESVWDAPMRRLAGFGVDEIIDKIRLHLARAKYDRVILTRFEDWQLSEEHYPIADKIDDVQTYDYGWTEEMLKDSGQRYTEGGNHSEVVWLPDWMDNLKGCKVSIAGAFDGECIEDLEIALSALGIKYKRLEKLIV